WARLRARRAGTAGLVAVFGEVVAVEVGLAAARGRQRAAGQAHAARVAGAAHARAVDLARLHAGRAGRAREDVEAAGQVVAVVVERVVARLRRRQDLAAAGRRPLAAGAGLRAVLAGADVLRIRRAVPAGARVAVVAAARRVGGAVAVGAVDVAVAVVVEAVAAALRRRQDRAGAGAPAFEL